MPDVHLASLLLRVGRTHLVINALIKVFDEYVSLTRFSKCRVALRPHDSTRAILDEGVVEML